MMWNTHIPFVDGTIIVYNYNTSALSEAKLKTKKRKNDVSWTRTERGRILQADMYKCKGNTN